MPARETAPVGAPCWVDLATSDAGRAQAFYGRVFGWSAEEPAPEFGGYFNFTRQDLRVAGCMPVQPGMDGRDVWSVYLATDDARKTVDAAEANGGNVVVPAMDVGELGTMAMVTDPGGAAVGVWQPGLHRGFGVLGEPGAPSWFELHTRDYESALGWYREVFGWTTSAVSDTPEFRYTTLSRDDEQLAGVMDASGGLLAEGAPGRWSVYFGVSDADASLDSIVASGGQVVLAAEDTPYGRLAAAADPMGAQFKLVAANEAVP